MQVDIRIAMVISLTVICLCIAIGVAVVVCCFVRSCPLYDACTGGSGRPKFDQYNSPAGGIFGGSGYIPSDMHPLTLNGDSNGDIVKNDEVNYRFASGVVKVSADADHV